MRNERGTEGKKRRKCDNDDDDDHKTEATATIKLQKIPIELKSKFGD